jgi:hypothetical protein
MMKSNTSVILYLVFSVQASVCFSFHTSSQSTKSAERGSCSRLYLIEDLPLLGEACLAETTESAGIFDLLKQRQDELDKGIGKRYICRTQKGFLNVHKEPGEPFNIYNIVNQLKEGDIVTSTGPPRGGWIRHNLGGWSIAVYNGFTWLEEVKE